MPGVMSWVKMNWLLPDFDETGLIYHGSRSENLVSIFQRELQNNAEIVQELKAVTEFCGSSAPEMD